MVKRESRFLKRMSTLNLKILKRKLKSSFMIYANFENIVESKNNGEQNPDETYTNKYKRHVACCYGH